VAGPISEFGNFIQGEFEEQDNATAHVLYNGGVLLAEMADSAITALGRMLMFAVVTIIGLITILIPLVAGALMKD
jgi:hypothetical protein